MNGPCDFVQFNYYGVSVLLIITSQKKFSVIQEKKLVRLKNWCAAQTGALHYIAVMTNDYSIGLHERTLESVL